MEDQNSTQMIMNQRKAVADKLKLPRIVLRTGGASSFVVFAAFPLLRERGYLPIQDSKLEEPVVELPPLKVKDLPVIDNCGPQTLDQVVDGMVNGAKPFLFFMKRVAFQCKIFN
ncbi:hypothetical protein LWI29_009959 [Acer saccharum]|uniref:Uncharacterized protein n=1 Tax=Acer saccharum TaxID=4024 RepID=A0AA39VV30_ACESA|nr:hypothetical protein LWI29_009959 [Acer saccharum]